MGIYNFHFNPLRNLKKVYKTIIVLTYFIITNKVF